MSLYPQKLTNIERNVAGSVQSKRDNSKETDKECYNKK